MRERTCIYAAWQLGTSAEKREEKNENGRGKEVVFLPVSEVGILEADFKPLGVGLRVSRCA